MNFDSTHPSSARASPLPLLQRLQQVFLWEGLIDTYWLLNKCQVDSDLFFLKMWGDETLTEWILVVNLEGVDIKSKPWRSAHARQTGFSSFSPAQRVHRLFIYGIISSLSVFLYPFSIIILNLHRDQHLLTAYLLFAGIISPFNFHNLYESVNLCIYSYSCCDPFLSFTIPRYFMYIFEIL